MTGGSDATPDANVNQDQPAQGGALIARHDHGRCMTYDRTSRDQAKETPVPPAVEHITGGKHERLPDARPVGKNPVQAENDDKKNRET